MQIVALYHEVGHTLPVCISLPGSNKQVPTHRIVAHTGSRVFNKWLAATYAQPSSGNNAQACAAADGAAAVAGTPELNAGRTDAQQGMQASEHSCQLAPSAPSAADAVGNASEAGAAGAPTAAGAPQAAPAAEAAAVPAIASTTRPAEDHAFDAASVDLLADVLCARAPERLTLAALCKLVDVAIYFNALAVCKHLHA